MIEPFTPYEVENFNDLKLRLLTPSDALEYFKAFYESRENNASFLDLELDFGSLGTNLSASV